MKSLVLGGCGFLGSHVSDALADKGHDVKICDIYHDAYAKYPVYNPDRETLDTLIQQSDKVYNFAGVLGTSSSFDYVSRILQVNTNFAVNVMERCLKYNTILISVGVPPAMWLNPYSITKTCMVQFSKMFYAEGLEGTTLIPYNIYGERQVLSVTEKLIPAVIHHILHNEPIIVYGQGQQIIDLMYAKDLAKYVADIEHFGPEIIHIGTGEKITVLKIVETICAKMGVNPNIEWHGTRKGEADEVYVVAPSAITGIELTSLSTGLDATINWYKKFEAFYKRQKTSKGRVSIIEPWDQEI